MPWRELPVALLLLVASPAIALVTGTDHADASGVEAGGGIASGLAPGDLPPGWGTAPVATDVTSSAFVVRWNARTPAAGSVEFSKNLELRESRTALDPRTPIGCPATGCLPSGAIAVPVDGLEPGTTYYFRLVEHDSIGNHRVYPAEPPFLQATTVTDAEPGPFSNPELVIMPFADRDGDGAPGSCTGFGPGQGEPRLRNFSATVAVVGAAASYPLSARGGGGSGGWSCAGTRDWRIVISLSNLRLATAAGEPLRLSGGEVLAIGLEGLLAEEGGVRLWSATSSFTICTPLSSCGLAVVLSLGARPAPFADEVGSLPTPPLDHYLRGS